MATTMTAPVANSIAYAQKYLPLLDEIYKRESLSAILLSPGPTRGDASTIHTMTSAEAMLVSAAVIIYSPSLFFARWSPGVSRNITCPLSSAVCVSSHRCAMMIPAR